jgi:hypothetical protein
VETTTLRADGEEDGERAQPAGSAGYEIPDRALDRHAVFLHDLHLAVAVSPVGVAEEDR